MKYTHLVWIRRICQSVFLIFFIYLLAGTRLPQDVYVDYTRAFTQPQDLRVEAPVAFFFHMDPLAWLSAVISARKLIEGFGWAMGLLLLTVLFGRFFCGFICPFGTLHHMAGSINPAQKGGDLIRANQKNNSRRIKYFLLITLLIAAIAGVNYSGLLDPISFLFRSLALSVMPAAGIAAGHLMEALAGSDTKLINYLGYGLDYLASPVFGYENKAFQTGWLIGLLFLIILFLNRIRQRFWCRTLCPLGALLGVFSKFSVIFLEKDQNTCTHCGACVKSCQGAAACEPGQEWQKAECLLCFNCVKNCDEHALSFRFRGLSKKSPRLDIGRRAVLGGLLAGFSIPFLGQLDGKIYKVSPSGLIRPPGSLPESEFLDRCQRCGLCMKACPTNVINPTLAEAGIAGFWTPNLIMRMGYCEYTCTLCGSVCPTGAIQELTGEKKIKTPVRIGSAFIDRGFCLPWSGNAPCIVCEEHCPTSPKAIYLKKDVITRPDGRKLDVQLPFVDLKRCVGCGICEYKCPVRGISAIRVISAGESRSFENQILL